MYKFGTRMTACMITFDGYGIFVFVFVSVSFEANFNARMKEKNGVCFSMFVATSKCDGVTRLVEGGWPFSLMAFGRSHVLSSTCI